MQLGMKLSVPATCCALMQDAGRLFSELVTNHPDKERGSPHVWFFTAMLKATEDNLSQKPGNGEKAESIKILRTTIENKKFPELAMEN